MSTAFVCVGTTLIGMSATFICVGTTLIGMSIALLGSFITRVGRFVTISQGICFIIVNPFGNSITNPVVIFSCSINNFF